MVIANDLERCLTATMRNLLEIVILRHFLGSLHTTCARQSLSCVALRMAQVGSRRIVSIMASVFEILAKLPFWSSSNFPPCHGLDLLLKGARWVRILVGVTNI
jgi:hypothetical protein